MKKRKLGRSGLKVAPLAFGGNVFGWTVDESTSFQLLDAFVASGFNLIDTADMYSTWAPGNKRGESETILGNWLKRTGNRGKVLIATKAGMEMGAEQKRTLASIHHERSRRFAAASPDGLHRSVSGPPGRSEYTFGRNAGHFRTTDPARKSESHRCIELRRGTAFGGARHQ
jgi:aryl-alcohol dehydrogenase-like predicted oxidoreductase